MKILFFVSLGLYALAFPVLLLSALLRRQPLKKAGWALFVLGLLCHLGYFVWRGFAAGRMPLSSQFEFACGLALGLALMLAVARTRVNGDWIAVAGAGATALVMGYAALQPMEINELMPALRSFWFSFHIGAAVFSYSSFLVAGCYALRYVVLHRRGESPDSRRMRQLEYSSYRLVALGFLLLTAVIVIGAIWAEAAWGRFWGWDPKETVSLISWVLYAAYLHARATRGWSGPPSAWLSIAGYLCIIFNFTVFFYFTMLFSI